MGCHTSFYRPITQDELTILRSKFDENYVRSFLGEEGICLVEGYKSTVFQFEIDKVIDSYNSSDLGLWIHWIDCSDYFIIVDNKIYVEVSGTFDDEDHNYILLKESDKFYYDNFRVKGFYHESWSIHNKRELKHKLRKHYYKLTKEELNQISQFWKDYPGGIIKFG